MPSFRVPGHAAISATLNHPRRTSHGRTSSVHALDGSDLRKVGRSYSIHSASTSRQPVAARAGAPDLTATGEGGSQSSRVVPLHRPDDARESLCLFSVLLPLCWWLTASIPRCVAAFAPVLTLPALQLMSPDETAAHFFESDSLEVVAFLALVTASHSSSGSLLRRLSYQFCSKYGLQVRALYLSLSCTTYVLAIFVNKSVLAVLFVVAVDKVLGCVHESELDKTLIEDHDFQEPVAKLSPLRRSKNFVPGATNRPDTEKLFARLAQTVGYLSDDTAQAVMLRRPDEDAANSTRLRKRFIDKLMRRSSAPKPKKPTEVTGVISALGRKISLKRDQVAPTTLDASVADVSRRKEPSALLDLFPFRDRRGSAQKLRRGTQDETATEKTTGAGTTVPFTAFTSGASPAPPAAPSVNKDGPKAPSDSIIEREDGAHAVAVKGETDLQEAPLATVHSVSKSSKEREVHPSNTQSANMQKCPDKRKESTTASSSAMEPEPAGPREGSTSKRRTTRRGSRRRKSAREDVALAAAPSEGGERSQVLFCH
ncbi:hypothetical protein MTO96_005878 [Rhipicephalus appendiculatus]